MHNKVNTLFIFFLSATVFTACSSSSNSTDKSPSAEAQIGDNSYTTQKFGDDTWMTQNLDTDKFRNGDVIDHVESEEAWATAGELGKPAWCYYENDPANGEKFGRLYNWYAVNDPRGLAPEGWHIPDDSEWQSLIEQHGGQQIAGARMKSTEGWEEENTETRSGFNALPSDVRFHMGRFRFGGAPRCEWWSSTVDGTDAVTYGLISGENTIERNRYIRSKGYSIRCIKD